MYKTKTNHHHGSNVFLYTHTDTAFGLIYITECKHSYNLVQQVCKCFISTEVYWMNLLNSVGF